MITNKMIYGTAKIAYCRGMSDFDLPEKVHDHVSAQLLGKSWGEFEALEEGGHLLFPEKVYKRKKDGSFEAVEIMLRVPREADLRKARLQARQLAQNDGLDLDRDRDLVENLETICTMAICIRNTTYPFEPYEPDPLSLEKRYDKTSLIQIWAKIDALSDVINPAPEQISEPEMLALLCALAKERSIRPLLVYGSEARNIFIATMAERLLTLQGSK